MSVREEKWIFERWSVAEGWFFSLGMRWQHSDGDLELQIQRNKASCIINEQII